MPDTKIERVVHHVCMDVCGDFLPWESHSFHHPNSGAGRISCLAIGAKTFMRADRVLIIRAALLFSNCEACTRLQLHPRDFSAYFEVI